MWVSTRDCAFVFRTLFSSAHEKGNFYSTQTIVTHASKPGLVELFSVGKLLLAIGLVLHTPRFGLCSRAGIDSHFVLAHNYMILVLRL